MSIFDITHNHGREMYILGLESAVSFIELLGDNGIDYVKQKIETERKELEDERAQQIRRGTSQDV